VTTLTTPKVIGAHLLKFKPILNPFLKKCKGAPISSGRCTSKTWSFSSACKNLGVQHLLGAEIWLSEKFSLSGYESTLRFPQLVDQSSPDFSHRTQEESRSIKYLADFEYLHPFQRYLPSNFEVDQNLAKFCMFWPLKFFLGGSPKILDQDY